MLKIEAIPSLTDNYIWVIHRDDSPEAWVVDPGDAQPVKNWLELHKKALGGILITHHHWDHVDGIEDLLTPSVEVYGPAKNRFRHTGHALREGDRLNLLGTELQVLELPGHTLDHIGYFSSENTNQPALLFCGDTLFCAGCGRLFEGTPEQMFDSLSKLAALAENTQVYCTHEYTLANLKFALAVEPENDTVRQFEAHCQQLRQKELPTLPSNIAQEKAVNPFLRISQTGIRMACDAHWGKQFNSDTDYFAALRRWKDTYR